MALRRRAPGFSLIEAMIVVLIVGVLAVLATLAYRRWTRSAYLAEAQDMVSNIRTAENNFFAENGGYLNVTGSAAAPALGKGASYPSPNPGATKSSWGGPCGTCGNPNAWQALGIQASGPVSWGYSCIAGDGVQISPSIIGSPKVNGQTIDYSQMKSPARPWFFVEADANLSGDGVNYMHVYAMSGTNTIYVDEEGN
jgi:type IV pilus assembly protein PilE